MPATICKSGGWIHCNGPYLCHIIAIKFYYCQRERSDVTVAKVECGEVKRKHFHGILERDPWYIAEQDVV